MTSIPTLTIVMPVRNAESTLDRSLGAVVDQDYPGLIEILVADGASRDRTADIIEATAASDGRVRRIDNPEGIVSTGLNRAVELATGSLLMRVDGHCVIPTDYASVCVRRLIDEGAACVGGVLRTVGITRAARAIAIAQASFAGVGNATFRTGTDRVSEVDTVAFGVYRTDHIRTLGGFDATLVRNQDDEFNLRVVQDGGRILIDPDVTVTYRSRATIRGLVQQYAQYGMYKPLVLRRRGRLPTLRSLVPAVLVLGLTASSLLASFAVTPAAGLLPLVLYATALALTGAWLGRRDPAAAPWVPVALAGLHVPYGLGFLYGLWRWRHAEPTPVRVDDEPDGG